MYMYIYIYISVQLYVCVCVCVLVVLISDIFCFEINKKLCLVKRKVDKFVLFSV